MREPDMELVEYPQERPCRVEAHYVAPPADARQRCQRLYLNSRPLPVRHIEECFRGRYVLQQVSASLQSSYNHCLEWPRGLPGTLRPLVDLLSTGLALPTTGSPLDLAMALDWYKVVDPDIPPELWQNTEAGELVRKAKYFVSSLSVRDSARAALAKRLAGMITAHPVMARAPYIVSVPGSRGDGRSTGEVIAAEVACITGKQYVPTLGPSRQERKGDQSYQLRGLFSIPTMLSAPCVIVDDVVRSGSTLREVGLLAKQAGAPLVYGLAAAKTRRS